MGAGAIIVAAADQDETATIQAAVDSGAGSIRLAPGTHRISRPIVIELARTGWVSIAGDAAARLVMAGPGPALQFVGTHAGSADPNSFKPQVWQRERAPAVDGLEIVGEHAEACGIEARGTMQLTLTRLVLRKLLHGVHLVERNRNVIVANSHIYENRGIGIWYDRVNLHQSNITGCHISYNGQGGVVALGGDVRNIQITGCDIEANQAEDQPPTANVLIDCTDSAAGVGEVEISGCTIQHGSKPKDSANIRIIGRSNPAKDQPLVREGHVTINGNVISDVQVNVHLRDCRDVVLTGNTFWMGYTHNLLVEDCTHVVAGDNAFDRNPRYAYGTALQANNGVIFRRCEDCTLNALHLAGVWRDPAALLVEKCKRMNITNCTVLDCDNVGIKLVEVSQSRLSGCLVRDDRPNATSLSLQVVGGSGNMIVGNLLAGGRKIDDGVGLVEGNYDGR